MCQPILLYGIPLSNSGENKLESTQGNLLKQSLGLNKRSHRSNLLKALSVNKIEVVIKWNTAYLLKRILMFRHLFNNSVVILCLCMLQRLF